MMRWPICGTACGLRPDESEESICREICDAAAWNARASAARWSAALGGSSNTTDREAHATRSRPSSMRASRLLEADRPHRLLPDEGRAGGLKAAARQRRFGPDTRQRPRHSRSRLCRRGGPRCSRWSPRLNVARAYDATAALLTVGDAILQAYHLAKRQAGALDFTDLIAKARNLLSRTDAAQWVLYKLDRRVDHILVDEAQDTSPDQWSVVQAIAEDFFSGEGAARAPRTIFAVGDDKQSIFGFQGADAAHAGRDAALLREARSTRRSKPSSRGRCSFRSARRRRCCTRSTRCSATNSRRRSRRRPTRRTRRNRPTSPGMSSCCRARCGRRRKSRRTGPRPTTRRARRRRFSPNNIADEIARIRDTRSSLRQARSATARS